MQVLGQKKENISVVECCPSRKVGSFVHLMVSQLGRAGTSGSCLSCQQDLGHWEGFSGNEAENRLGGYGEHHVGALWFGLSPLKTHPLFFLQPLLSMVLKWAPEIHTESKKLKIEKPLGGHQAHSAGAIISPTQHESFQTSPVSFLAF